MGYLPTSPQRNSPGRVGVGKNLLVSRGENVRPLMVPSPRSPGARRHDRPLADMLDDNEFNPLRRKYKPATSIPAASSHGPSGITGKSRQTLMVLGLPAGLPLTDTPGLSTAVSDTPDASPTPTEEISASATRSPRRNDVLERSSQPPPASAGLHAGNATVRPSRCYAYVPIPHLPPSVESQTDSVSNQTDERKKKVSFVSASRVRVPQLPKVVDTREQDRKRIEELQRELQAIESSKATELQEIRDGVQRAKQQLDEEIRASAERAELDCLKLQENRRILAGLKAENDKIRILNQEIAENNRNLRINNNRLEHSLKTTLHLHGKLNEYQRKEAQTQQKLEKKCRHLDQSIQWLLYQVEETDDYTRRQAIRVIAYKEAFDALVPLLDQNGHPELARHVRNLYESVSSKNSMEKGLHADSDTCTDTLSSTDMESDSEFEL